jgi:hypothetical protein
LTRYGSSFHVLVRVDRVLDLSWLWHEVADVYCLDDGRPGIDPEVSGRSNEELAAFPVF